MLKKVEWLEVVSVEPDGAEECVCISVADPSKLYATGQGILTHNTTVKGLKKEYVAVTAATGELRASMKLVKSSEDERTIDGVRVADTQYKTRSFEDMAPLAEAVIDSWQAARLDAEDVLDLLRNGEHSDSGQSLEGGERILLINSLFGTGRFRDFGILQSDLSRVVQELTGDAGFILRGVQEFLDPIAKMKAEADAQTEAEVKKVTGATTEELVTQLEREAHAEQLAELEAALAELRKQNGSLAASIQEAATERLARAEEVARLRNLLKLEEKRSKELATRPDGKEQADQRLADEVVKSRAKIRELTKKLAEAEGLFARGSEGPSATRAMENFNLWIMGGAVKGVPPLEVLASQFIKLSRFDRDGLRDGIRRLFPMLNTNVLDDALDRIVAELEGSREVDAEAEEPTLEVEREVEDLRSQLADERGRLVAATSTWEKILAVFKAAGGRKSKTLGDIAKGAAAVREAAKARMAARAKEGRVNSLPVEDLADSAIIGATFFAEGIVNLTDWSQAMIRTIGEHIRPHLNGIFTESSKLYLEDVEREAAKPREPKAKKEPKAPKEKKPSAKRPRSAKGDVEAAEKTLRQLYEEDGAKRIAEAFFRAGTKAKTKALLGEGSALLNSELSRVLDESLNALGIEHNKEKKNPQDVFRQVAVTLGLDNLRDGKMAEIDKRVREEIAKRAGDGELANDLLDQWEAISAGMLGSPVSGTIARRMARLILSESGLSPADLAGMSDVEARQISERVGVEVQKRIDAIEAFDGRKPGDSANVRVVVIGTIQAMVAKVKADRAAAALLRQSPAALNDRAKKIVDRLAADFSDTPTWPGPKTPDALRALVNEAMSARGEMADLSERAKALGVSDEVAAQLVSMVLEARRRKEVVLKAKKASRLAEARQRAITRLVDKLEGKVKPKSHENLGKFLGSLKRASDWGILDKDVFSQAFAHAFSLNGLTPARVQQLHSLWHQLRNSGTYGMVRETLEQQFLDAVNAVAPAARWDNALFSAFMSKVLSSLSSVVNQFDGITRILSPLTAITNALYTGDPGAAVGNYASGLARLAKGLPFWLTGARGESLGHLPSEIGNGFKPGEQQLSRTTGAFRVRLPGGRVIQLSPTTTQVLRWMELYSWRLIRGAEGLVGSAVDARSSYQDALTQYYRGTGMKPAAARKQALRDIAAGPSDIAVAKAQAKQEQASGLIGTGEHVLKRRAEEIIQQLIDQRLGADIVKQAEHFTAYMNFKTDPVGPFGHLATQIVKGFIPTDINGQAQSFGRLSRFWLMFPRFFGNLVDRSIGYIPGLHLLNHAVTTGNRGTEANIIEIFGSVQNYRRYNNARAGAGAAIMIMAAALLAVSKALRDDEDEEPWFDITGSLPSSNREQKARLKASGKWTETTLKIGSLRFNYASFGELSPVLTMIGNANDYLTHGEATGFDGVAGAGYQLVADTAAAPVRRSTYKQWLQLVSNISGGANAQAGEAGLRNASALLVAPLGAVLKVPLVTDLDRLYRGDEVRVASTLGEKVLSKVPFVKVGNALITPYGERVQGMPFLGMLGDDLTDNADIIRAARLNLDTNTIRNVAQVPDAIENEAEGLVFQELAGKLYVSGMVKNEATIRAKLEAGDAEEAQWIIRAVAAMANASAKSQTWPELYGKDAKAEAAKAAAEERRENKRERGSSYVLPP